MRVLYTALHAACGRSRVPGTVMTTPLRVNAQELQVSTTVAGELLFTAPGARPTPARAQPRPHAHVFRGECPPPGQPPPGGVPDAARPPLRPDPPSGVLRLLFRALP